MDHTVTKIFLNFVETTQFDTGQYHKYKHNDDAIKYIQNSESLKNDPKMTREFFSVSPL